ncbi:hypothetical protein HYH02_006326 [Chlamydomonas schloesseri]|uniref:Peptidase S54 rhomboid domain-containing protein n=1 Tax=Chlamydomonas schloesseri TaxID=2026947 RepID=A0A836B672_9CHLO|nr:hypothetical protein HYH02_006326 [Chlamydomonas schloesseri]|eukprot:KAG2448434.1 hypothetical protein HYH02_006326 [Chlamydomonas schloesseri]
MQQDARNKIAELAAKQIAAQQQQQQQQRQQQQQQAASAASRLKSNITESSPPAATRPSPATDESTASVASAAAAAAARTPEQGPTVVAATTTEPGARAAPESTDEASWGALRSELEGDWQRLRDRWRQFLARPLETPDAPSQQRKAQSASQPASAGGGGAQPLEVVVPQVVGPDGSVLPSSGASSSSSSSSSSGGGTSSTSSTGPGAGPSAPAGAATGALAAAQQQQQEGQAGDGDAGDGDDEAYELVVQRGATRVLQLACLAVFAAQWAPVLQAVMGGGVAAPALKDGLLALLLACPPTSVTMSMQMDVFSVSNGNWAGVATSTLLHSGLLSLLVSLWSLDFTGAWLETAHGTAILAISLLMAGGGAAAGQLLAGQPAGIGGIGAALGLEAAVAVRSVRLAGELPPLRAGGLALVAVAVAMAVYQPLVGPWALVGGMVGGALSGVLAYDVLWLLRVVLGVTLLLCITVWDVLTWLPRQLWRLLVAAAMFAWGTVVAIVQAVRGV